MDLDSLKALVLPALYYGWKAFRKLERRVDLLELELKQKTTKNEED